MTVPTANNWQEHIDQVLQQVSLRRRPHSSEARRLFHGRGHCFSGLEGITLEALGTQWLIILYAEFAQEDVDRLAAALVEEAQSWEGEAFQALIVQRRYLPGAPSEVYWGELIPNPEVSEQGLKFGLNLGRNQNLGLFVDMAAGRQWVREHAKGRKVLNLFAYTCGFSVAAMAGGADQVINLDMSKGALAQGKRNHQLNDHSLNQIKFLSHELFRSWGKLKRFGPYELMIADPPSFQRGSFDANKDYERMLKRIPDLVVAGGDVLLCLNDPGRAESFVHDLVATTCPQLQFVERIASGEDFPEAEVGGGLKVLHFAYQP